MSEEINTKEKFCTACKRWLPIDKFSGDKHSPDLHYYICKECTNQRARDLRRKKNEKKKELERQEIEQRTEAKTKLNQSTPRELMEELLARGFEGELTIITTFKLANGQIINTSNFKGLK